MGVSAAVGTYYQRGIARRREEQFNFEKFDTTTNQV